MKPSFDILLVTADEPYLGPWHTQLIYTEYLASQTEVFFLDPPTKWSIRNLFRFSSKERQINKNLTVINYQNIFPSFFPLFNSFNEWYNQMLIKRKLRKKKVNSVLIWHFDSFRNCFDSRSFTKEFRVKRIYHIIDPFMNNPKNKLLSSLADLLVITSPRLNKYYPDFQEKLINIPQVLNLELSRNLLAGKIKSDTGLQEKFVVLIGTISDDIDYDWLLALTEPSSINLVLIGKIASLVKGKSKFDTLIARQNIRYLGLMSPAEFYPIVAKAKAGLVIHNEEKRTKISSSLKTVNYLLAGVPVISNIDSEVNTLDNTCIYRTDTLEEFRSAVTKALENNLSFDTTSASRYLDSISLEKAVTTILSKI